MVSSALDTAAQENDNHKTTSPPAALLQDLLHDPTALAKVLSFPQGHCWSSAMGFVQSSSNKNKIFVKDRDDDEALVQQTIAEVGAVFSTAFCVDSKKSIPSVVAHCQWMDRPASPNDFKVATPGYNLWTWKEEQWKRQRQEFLKQQQEKQQQDDDDESDSSSEEEEEEEKPAPSEFDCWQLEQAVPYSLDDTPTTTTSTSSDNNNTTDTSLRDKLRRAAQRTDTGCLDLFTALMTTDYSQDLLRNDPEWKDYQSMLVPEPQDALTAAETHCWLHEKLQGLEFEAAVLFTAALGLPDVNFVNLALQEVVDHDNNNWYVRLVHFDTGLVPPTAGVSLEPLKVKTKPGPVGHDFLGGVDCVSYYFPVLLSLPAVQQPLSAAAIQALEDIASGGVAERMQQKLERDLANNTDDDDILEDGLEALGSIVRQRMQLLRDCATTTTKNQSLRTVVLDAIAAWKRDWPTYREESEEAEFIDEILEWAADNR